MINMHDFTRREFLYGARAVLAGTALGVGATYGGQEANSPGVRFAVMGLHPLAKSYSRVGGPWATKPLREMAGLLRQLGYQGIDLGEAWVLTPEAILEALEGTAIMEQGLRCSGPSGTCPRFL